MRQNRLVMVGGLLLAAAAAEAQAAIDVYYAKSDSGSVWYEGTYDIDSNIVPGTLNWGPSLTDQYGSKVTPVYLAGTFTANQDSNSPAPSEAIVGTGGKAHGNGWQDFSLNSSGFVIDGQGFGEVEFGPGASAEVLVANGAFTTSFNFHVPAGPDQYLLLNGTAHAEGYTKLMLRIGESADGNGGVNILDIDRDGSDPNEFTQSFNNQLITLKGGYYYAVDLYADANWPYGDTSMPEYYSSLSEIHLTASVVPEPAVFGVLVAGSVVTLRRRRAK